ncbi:MAG: BamA/TamA family outer membrane protein [Bacteroidota bacterium]|jgi:outer membrane protein assembly factor BamA
MSLLKSNDTRVEEPIGVELEKQLTTLYKQVPNRKLFGLFNSRPYFYIRGSKGNDNFVKKFMRNSLGEQPVFTDSLFIDNTVKSMQNFMVTKGYFYPEIRYEVEVNRRKKAKVTYFIKPNMPYKVMDYRLHIEDKQIYDLVNGAMDESFVKWWKPLDQGLLIKEQERIINQLRNNGYYVMGKEFVDFSIDTNDGKGFCILSLNIRNPTDDIHEKYYNKQVTIEVDPNNQGDRGLLKRDTFAAFRIMYKPAFFKLNPEVLNCNILMLPNNEFRQNSINRTYSRLSELGIFRFVNIQSTPFERNDSLFLNYNIRLIPNVKYTATIEPQATLSDQNNTLTGQDFRNYGVAILTQFTNRNVFRNAEILQLTFRSAVEAQGQIKSSGFFNSTEQRLTAAVIMPRTLLFSGFDRNEKYYSNKTIFSATGVYELNIDYERQVLSTGINYQLNRRLTTLYFWPLEVSYIRSNIRSPELQTQSANDIFLQNLFTNNLIAGSRLGFVYSNKEVAKGLSFIYLRWDLLDLAGYPLSLYNRLAGGTRDEDGSYTVFGVKYFEFAKSTIDIRYNTVYDQNNSTVFRLLAGYALPYGNTRDFVPFERRYFVGGANDLRGWRPRSLGPGGYKAADQLDYSGEIKLMANAEFRFNMYNRWLEGAVFADAGNVWIAKPNENRPWGEFDINRFYKEIAFNTGLGIRLNLEIFIIRLDFALPMHDPTFPKDKRWIIRDFSSQWLLDNFNFNFGIGYPF